MKEVASQAKTPTVGSMVNLKRIGRYVTGHKTVTYEFPFQKEIGPIVAHGDSNWAGCRRTRRSTSSGTIQLGKVAHLVDHFSVTQQVIALSSGEAELYSMGKTAAHGLQLKNMLD